jgi:hypothetical protein
MVNFDHEALEQWATAHKAQLAVACAIHAIANSKRTAEDIWAAPTHEEWYGIADVVGEYVDNGDFEVTGEVIDDCARA